MKINTFLTLFFLNCTYLVSAQGTSYSMNGSGGNTNNGTFDISFACSGLTNSANIALIGEQVPGSNSVKFYLAKRTVSTCSAGGNSNFSGGTFRLFQSGTQVGGDVAVGTTSSTSPPINRTMPHTTGTRTFTAQFISTASGQTWSISNIVVTATPVCNLAAPSTGSVSSITTNSFTGSWNSISGANSYTVDVEINGNSYPGTQYTTTSTSYNFPNLNSGTTYKYQVRSNCSNGASGSFGQTITTATTLAPQPNLTIANNVSFGTTTLYSGVNYTGTFSVRNTGNGTWNGNMYVVLGHGGTLNATGPSTINAGSTQSYTVSYTPNTVQSNTSAYASYQTNGQGSGVTVPGQTVGSFSIVGNLAITGNVASPTSGTQNNTNFSFNAVTSNVAPSPTVTVDIEFISPDGVTTTVTNITRSGNNYSHTRTLQQVGTYQYRYIAYQGTRPNAATAWQSLIVTAAQPNLTIGTNVSFGGTTLYASVPYTTTFSVSNTGSAAWSGSMYVALSNGNTLSIGSATINAGSTNNFSYSFTPSASDVGTGITATAKYQTVGIGSGISVPNQTVPTINIIGNLGITGNTISPTTGTQNVTNFTFGATLSNVAPSPTLGPTVDIEFLAPDGLTYTTTNIPNIGGNSYSKTQTLLQAGTYQYRYIAYQGGRQNIASGWQTVIISAQPAINIGTVPSTMIWNCVQNINWTSVAGTGNISIELTNASGNSVATIADGIPNTGSFAWTVGKNNLNLNIQNFNGGTYKIKIYPTGTFNQATISNTTFTITTPTISISQPTATNYIKGQSMNIVWATSSNYCGLLFIEYVPVGGTSVVIASNIANDGTETWMIPNTLADGSYYIKVYSPVSSGPSPVTNVSATFTIGPNLNCPNCITGQTVANFVTTAQEGLCAAQYLCSKGIIQAAQPNPTNQISREDVSKISLLSALPDADISTVVNGGLTFPADFFPTTFIDLFQGTTGSYHRYAKILSYFQGSDQTTPFNRYKPNSDSLRLFFNPANPISRIDLIKEYLETWNIDEISNGNPTLYFSDISGLTTEQTNYLKKAIQLGLLVNGTAGNLIAFRPNANATREEAFLILYRLRALANPTKPDFTNNANYYQPANQSIGNMSIMKGLEQGNFSHYQSTDFGINDIGFSLNFAHSYQSFITMLPDEWKVVQPMGYGWTHPYNAYMFTTVQINDAAGGVAGKPLLVMAWGDGTFETYDNTNTNSPMPMSVGTNYNALTRVNTTTYTIKTKSQHLYTFSQQGTEAGLYRLTSIKDRYNNTLSVVYKAGTVVAFSPVKQVIDYVQAPSGRRINFTYDTQNRVTNVNFPGSVSNTRNLTFAYTGKNLTSFKDAKGQATTKTTSYSYGTGIEMYLLKQITFPKGNKIENVFDPNGRLSWTQARDASNNVTAKTEITSFGAFNANGGFRNTVTQNCSCPNASRTVDFDKNGIQTEMVNQVVTIKSPASANHPTLPQNIQYIGGAITQTYTPSYDALGNVLSISRPDGKTESSTYDTYNNRLTQTDAKGITTTFNWSGDGKFLNSITRPIGNGSNLTQSFGYNANGLPSSATNNEGIVTNFGYDGYGNQNLIQIPVLSISSSAVYDYASRMTSSTNARNKTTSFLYDANDNLTRETDPLNRQTNFGYDDNDNLLTITNAKNQVTTLAYDGFDRLISEEFGGKTKTYLYDNSQNRLAEFRKAGYAADNTKRFSYVYDSQNRLKGNGYITDIMYDDLNRMSSIKGGTVATNQLSGFSYDALNRLTSYTDQWNNTIGYGYDDNGNETRIDYPNGNKLYKTYDNLNRLKTLTWNTTLVATYNYVGSRLDNVVYGNGVKTQMGYDNASRPNGISTKTNNGNGSTIYAASFVMDNLGNHTEENETHPFATIPTPTAGSTTYNYTNNRLNSESTTNGTTSTGKTYTHDNDGNITNKGFGYNLNYDLEDNLTNYTNGSTTLAFEYDAFGNRRKAIRNGTETRYIKDINGLATDIAETNSSNAVQHYYIHGLGLVARVKPDGTTINYYHADFRGSTIAMTNASQAITHKYQYDEFGNLTNSQEADPNPYRYVGAYGIMYEAHDLTYMRARYYDPTTGRFNSEDPIWSTNVYPYAGNNGVMNVDYSGKSFIKKTWDYVSLDDGLVEKVNTFFQDKINAAKYFSASHSNKGNDKNLTKNEVKKITSSKSKTSYSTGVVFNDGTTGTAEQKSFYNTNFSQSLGTATIYKQNNNVVGVFDCYDADAKAEKIRPKNAEGYTKVLDYVMGEKYNIRYGKQSSYYENFQVSGNSCQKPVPACFEVLCK
jgi:RHS repeat-associated protein